MLQSLLIHHQHDQVHALDANLQSPASPTHTYECRSAPAGCGATAGDPAAVLSADDKTTLDEMGYYHDALGISPRTSSGIPLSGASII